MWSILTLLNSRRAERQLHLHLSISSFIISQRIINVPTYVVAETNMYTVSNSSLLHTVWLHSVNHCCSRKYHKYSKSIHKHRVSIAPDNINLTVLLDSAVKTINLFSILGPIKTSGLSSNMFLWVSSMCYSILTPHSNSELLHYVPRFCTSQVFWTDWCWLLTFPLLLNLAAW